MAINNMTGSLATRASVLVVAAFSFFFFSGVTASAQEIPSGTEEIGRYCPNPAGCQEWEVIVLPPAPQPVQVEVPVPSLRPVHVVVGVGALAATDTDIAGIGELGLRVKLTDWANWQFVGFGGIDGDTEFVGGLQTAFNFRIADRLTLGPSFRWSADTGGPVPSPETHMFLFGPRAEWQPTKWGALGLEFGPAFVNGDEDGWGIGGALTWRLFL